MNVRTDRRPCGRTGHTRCRTVGLCCCFCFLSCSASFAETKSVVIEGGADASAHQYEWTVTNRRASPIRDLEFPHHGASVFLGPDRWSIECTNLVGIGVKNPTGVCVAKANSAIDEISEGRSATFRMQISGGGAKRGTGSVTVRFADGTSETVTGVVLPTAEGVGDRNVPLYGMAVIFLILVATRLKKRRNASIADRVG